MSGLAQVQSVKKILKEVNLAEATKETYGKKYRQFLRFLKVSDTEFANRVFKNPEFAEESLRRYSEENKDKVSGSTIRGFRDSVRFFLKMRNLDKDVNWSRLNYLIPHSRKIGKDRAPSIEEVRKIVANADTRLKSVILIMASSGIRVGAFDSLNWGDMKPIMEEGAPVGARLTVYRGERDEYQTFISPECYETITEYRNLREKFGETIKDNSPLIREALNTRLLMGNEVPKPTKPKRVSSKSIKNEIGHLLWKVGLRSERKRVHEFKLAHGFRKFFKSRCELAGVKTLNVEILMGHQVGLSSNYYKPTDNELFEDYRKAIPHLTVSEVEEVKLESDRKVGKIEGEIQTLYDRLDKMERDNSELRELIKRRSS
ncbi:MAG: site-specific integrase [Thaumarchaeota archaeon]|nr:site-specific integrase [Nitrososphaerota archaeon]